MSDSLDRPMDHQYQEDYYVGSGSNYGKLPGGYNFLRRAIFWEGKIDIIKRYVQSGNALDIGCSYGFFLYFLKKWFKIYGCDISSHAIGVCKKIFPSLPDNRFWVHNIEHKLPFPEDYFSLVICMDVIEHINDVLLPLRHIYNSLTQDGIFLLKIPIRTRYKIIEFLRFDNDPTHVSVLPEKILISKVKQIGFKVLEKHYYLMGFIPFPNFLKVGTDLLMVLKK